MLRWNTSASKSPLPRICVPTALGPERVLRCRPSDEGPVIEKAIQGKETIDASGHVVCPGFIDMHHTGPSIVFVNGRSHSGLRRDGR
jgi:hypothetical protein